jgi:molybdate transport system permease protein
VNAPVRERRGRSLATTVLALTGVGVLVLLTGLPFLAVLVRMSPAGALAKLASPEVVAALRLSLLSSLAATTLVAAIGLPTAYLLATRDFPGRAALEVLLDLPMVTPPTVAGFALLMAFGRMGLAGRALSVLGITLPFTTLGVVVAQAFMSAPFFVAAARAGIAGVDTRLLEAAATLGADEATRFRRIVLPLASPSLLAGLAMAAARSLGEFGATITFAGNLPGTTQTMPLAVYVAMQSDLDTALVLSVLLLALSVILLFALRATRGLRAEGGLAGVARQALAR